MRVSGDLSVILGAVLVALIGFEHLCDAIIAAGDGRYWMAAFYLVAAFGCGAIAREVWRAA